MNKSRSKIKVAMICYFSTQELRAHLPLDNRKLYSFARKVLGMPAKRKGYGDLAPWTSKMISILSSRNDIDLCVITPHSGLKRKVVSFEQGDVKFNVVNCDYGNLLSRLIKNDELWRKVNPVSKTINLIVDAFSPDIVVLVGAENSFYALSILPMNKYPIYVLCQTIYNNPERALFSKIESKSASTEMRIFREKKYFGVYSKKHYDLLRPLNLDAYIFKFGFPSDGTMLKLVETEKCYDFVNFALSLDAKKGATDSVQALAIVKKKFPNVTLNLTGGCVSPNREILDKLISDLDLKDNVVYTPFFEKQSDLFLHVQKSRFAVLPCKMDDVATTMVQSMQLGLPLIVYKTTGTPAFNRNKRCALIAELGNVEELASYMIKLLEDAELAKELRANALEYQKNRMKEIADYQDRLVDNFYSIVENYRNGTPIPEAQLFNPERDE